jgi:hypothetical protein
MNLQERSALLRRITNGYFYTNFSFKNNKYKLKFIDPTPDLLCEADFYISNLKEDLSNHNLISLEESYDILKRDGRWSNELDLELDKLNIDITLLEKKLLACEYKLIEQRALSDIIIKKKSRIEVLENKKNSLYNNTQEYFLDLSLKKFILQNITIGLSKDSFAIPGLIETLIVCYYKDHSISESTIRTLARTDPWRIYWTVSKTTSTSLFRHASVEMTDLQYALVSWTRVYDFAFEHPSSPGDDIINDDVKFDAWYKNECNKISQDRKNSVSKTQGNKLATHELFIPADKEGAKKVYELNDSTVRSKIKQRQKVINELNIVNDADLPDIKRDIAMHSNKIGQAKIAERGKNGPK